MNSNNPAIGDQQKSYVASLNTLFDDQGYSNNQQSGIDDTQGNIGSPQIDDMGFSNTLDSPQFTYNSDYTVTSNIVTDDTSSMDYQVEPIESRIDDNVTSTTLNQISPEESPFMTISETPVSVIDEPVVAEEYIPQTASSIPPESPQDQNPVSNDPKSGKSYYWLWMILGSLLFIVIIAVGGYFQYQRNQKIKENADNTEYKPLSQKEIKFEKFKTEDEFKTYFAEASNTNNYYGGGFSNVAFDTVGSAELQMAPMALDNRTGSGSLPGRVSTTNVQVEGIDEPDIVKTNGEQIFYANLFTNYYKGMEPEPGRPVPLMQETVVEDSIGESSGSEGVAGEDVNSSPTTAPDTSVTSDMVEPQIMPVPLPPTPYLPPEVYQNKVNVISAFPPEELANLSEINQYGNMLLVDDTLVIFADRSVYGYDISNPAQPVQSWKIDYKDNTYYHDARLYGDKIYLVTQTNYDQSGPCPIIPYMMKGSEIKVYCTDIYHPSEITPVDSTYIVSEIDIGTGNVDKTVSMVGSSYQSTLYMSPDNIYIAYPLSEEYANIMIDFINKNAIGLFPAESLKRLANLQTYDISAQAKMVELEAIKSELYASMGNDARIKFENDMQNKWTDYVKTRLREFETTSIVKINRDNLNVEATGKVPGRILNQFAMDEYEDTFRIATTVGETVAWQGGESENDVYTLDSNMNRKGEVKGMGVDERIYSVRFMGDLAYLVTFRETDPFYVLDLSNPNKPEVKGELKIPGYSSYLHQLKDGLILGVGQEGSNVKLSLFDVSDPSNPREVSKYTMQEYWSEALNNHRAFLQDSDNEVFFIPGSQSGYIFGYSNGELELVKAVDVAGAKRALYIDEYMYVIGEDELIVLDQNDWERVRELEI